MKVIPVDHPDLGIWLRRWLERRDLNFADSGHDWSRVLPSPHGVVTEDGWVVFHRPQLVLPVGNEVHSYWHHPPAGQGISSRVWRVEESAWLASFDPRHLARCHHFVLDFWDYILEVICEALLFGEGAFDLERAIERYPPLADAYFWRADQKEKRGDTAGAIADYLRTAQAEGAFFQTSARRNLALLGWKE